MKKFSLLLIIVLFSVNCAMAKSVSLGSFGKMIKKPVASEKAIAAEQSSEDVLTPTEQAILLYNDNNLNGAFDVLLKIKEADRTAQDWLLLGNILQDQDKNLDAVFMYQRAVLINPKFYKAYYNLGNIYLEEEKNHLAIDNYRKANKANNQFAYAYYNLGCAYLKVGDLKKAKIAFLKAIELKNTEPDFHYNLAYTYKKLNNSKLSKQYLGFYNKLIENNQ